MEEANRNSKKRHVHENHIFQMLFDYFLERSWICAVQKKKQNGIIVLCKVKICSSAQFYNVFMSGPSK